MQRPVTLIREKAEILADHDTARQLSHKASRRIVPMADPLQFNNNVYEYEH